MNAVYKPTFANVTMARNRGYGWLVGSLFYDAFSVARQYSADNGVTSE
jgi:hypothetical protein